MTDHFSYSQVRSFTSCEYKWFIDKVLGIRRIQIKRAPTMGSAIHKGIAARIAGDDANKAINDYMDAQYKKLEKHIGVAPGLAEEDWDFVRQEVDLHALPIVDRWADWIKLDEWETVVHGDFGPLLERKLVHVEIGHNAYDLEFEFPWIVDWVALHKPTGLTWVIDWKTTSQFQDDQTHERALQKMVYQYLLDQINIEVSGSRVAQIRSKAPSIPKLNMNGSMSRAKISTTWAVYEKALLDAGLTPGDYVDMPAKFPDESYWFDWMAVHRSDAECTGAWHQIVLPAIARMKRVRAEASDPIRNLGSIDCTQMCSVQFLCMETLRGFSLDNLLDFGYERKDLT